MKDVYTRRFYKSAASSTQSHYGTSEIREYLENDFYNLFEDNIRQKLITVNLPTVHGTTVSPAGAATYSTTSSLTLSSRVFLLAAREIGSGTKDNYDSVYDDVNDGGHGSTASMANDGRTLDYFTYIESDTTRSTKRVAYYGSQAIMWFLRTPCTW